MTQYMFSVHHEVGDAMPTATTCSACSPRSTPSTRRSPTPASGCSPAASSRSRRPRRSTPPVREPVITDGPYAETKEWIGGFWVIEAPDLDAALKLATEGSAACEGKVEVRPFQPVT